MTIARAPHNLIAGGSYGCGGRRSGFTLVELMISIMILGILTTLILSAMSSAMEAAREDRTEAQIRKLHELIMQRWESYELRRVPSRIAFNATNRTPDAMAKHRVDRIRELMRMEMPDRLTDIISPSADANFQPKWWKRYVQMTSLASASATDLEYQSAECLYMIISTMEDGERNALEFFTAREIGDKDGDGLKEIWDAWGTPIEFLRWAPGYSSKIQPTDVDLQQKTVTQLPEDPFDVRGVYDHLRRSDSLYAAGVTYALTPLIISAGPDRKLDIVTDFETPLVYAENGNNPYLTTNDLRIGLVADVDDDEVDSSIDNITNHGLLSN
jgi:prepilin-type N-terminal cleavage/methylation domain-containing protein